MVKKPPSNAGDLGLVRELRSPQCCGAAKPVSLNYWHVPQRKIPHAATKTRHSQINKYTNILKIKTLLMLYLLN